MSSAELAKLEAIEQSLHVQTAQRNALQSQLLEIENASKELVGAQDSYRIIGNIMVKAPPEKLQHELQEKSITLKNRITSVERQEKKLQEELQQLKQKLLQ